MGAVLIATVTLWRFKDPGMPGGIWAFEEREKGEGDWKIVLAFFF